MNRREFLKLMAVGACLTTSASVFAQTTTPLDGRLKTPLDGLVVLDPQNPPKIPVFSDGTHCSFALEHS